MQDLRHLGLGDRKLERSQKSGLKFDPNFLKLGFQKITRAPEISCDFTKSEFEVCEFHLSWCITSQVTAGECCDDHLPSALEVAGQEAASVRQHEERQIRATAEKLRLETKELKRK